MPYQQSDSCLQLNHQLNNRSNTIFPDVCKGNPSCWWLDCPDHTMRINLPPKIFQMLSQRHKHLTSLYHNINIITCISFYLKQTIRLVYSCLEVAVCCELLYETNSSSLIFYPSHINIPSSSNLKLSNISLSQHVGTCTR